MVDNFDIRTLNLAYLRAQMGIVTQEPVLFDCTLRENIAYGSVGFVTDTMIFQAAKTANIHNFIIALPLVCCNFTTIELNRNKIIIIFFIRATILLLAREEPSYQAARSNELQLPEL
jgi:ABC-type multidrug transport system fused ATPase/permease subunit